MTLAKKVHRATSVFVPGGMPSLTYVDRAGRELEKRLAAVSDNLCKLVTLTGANKVGQDSPYKQGVSSRGRRRVGGWRFNWLGSRSLEHDS